MIQSVDIRESTAELMKTVSLFAMLGCNPRGLEPNLQRKIFYSFIRPKLKYGFKLSFPTKSNVMKLNLSIYGMENFFGHTKHR